VLSGDLNLAQSAQKKKGGAITDKRTLSDNAVMRKVFKEMNALGSHRSSVSLFGTGSRLEIWSP
jgi:hypothetical protein